MKTLVKFFIVASFFVCIAVGSSAQVSVRISIRITPPALPVYSQPYCPGSGYLWMPGYWAYDQDGYYWVPGTWVLPPEDGFLWTPGYWDFSNGYYVWNEGYWGRHVGFYGGVNYGYGYGGIGYCGGEWRGNTFRYNTAVNNVNTTVIHNTYIDKTIVNNTTIINNNRSSFHGQGGVVAKPTQQEKLAQRESHVKPTSSQLLHESSARADKNQFVSVNHGHPQKVVEPVAQNTPALHPENNHAANPVNHNIQRSVKPNQNTTVRNNKQQNVSRQAHNNTQSQVTHPTNERSVATRKQVNGNKVTRKIQANQQQIKNQQVNSRDEQKSRQANKQRVTTQKMNANSHQHAVQGNHQLNANNTRSQVHQNQPRGQANTQHPQPPQHNGAIVRNEGKGKEREK